MLSGRFHEKVATSPYTTHLGQIIDTIHMDDPDLSRKIDSPGLHGLANVAGGDPHTLRAIGPPTFFNLK